MCGIRVEPDGSGPWRVPHGPCYTSAAPAPTGIAGRGASGSVPSDQVTGLEQAAGARASRHPLSTLCEYPATDHSVTQQHTKGQKKSNSWRSRFKDRSVLDVTNMMLLVLVWPSCAVFQLLCFEIVLPAAEAPAISVGNCEPPG